jgi:hypothetical protein
MSRRPTPSTITRDVTIPARVSPVEKEIAARTASNSTSGLMTACQTSSPMLLRPSAATNVGTVLAEPRLRLVCGEPRRTAPEPLVHDIGRQGRRLEKDRGDLNGGRLAAESGKDAFWKSDGGARHPGTNDVAG